MFSEGPVVVYCEAEGGFNSSEKSSYPRKYPGLRALPVQLTVKLKSAPIPGFNNQSLIHIANKPWVTLLDGGATCSSIPEEMLEEVFNLTAMAVEKKEYTWGSL